MTLIKIFAEFLGLIIAIYASIFCIWYFWLVKYDYRRARNSAILMSIICLPFITLTYGKKYEKEQTQLEAYKDKIAVLESNQKDFDLRRLEFENEILELKNEQLELKNENLELENQAERVQKEYDQIKLINTKLRSLVETNKVISNETVRDFQKIIESLQESLRMTKKTMADFRQVFIKTSFEPADIQKVSGELINKLDTLENRLNVVEQELNELAIVLKKPLDLRLRKENP